MGILCWIDMFAVNGNISYAITVPCFPPNITAILAAAMRGETLRQVQNKEKWNVYA